MQKSFRMGTSLPRFLKLINLKRRENSFLKKLRRGSSNSYAAIKKLVWESQFKDWQSYATLELNLQESLAKTEDFKEGVRAHFGKKTT